MKKTFLIAGLIVGLTATNGYADIVISQTDENPDTIITVARAAKTKPRVTPQTTNTYEPVSVEPGSITKVSSGFVNIECPEGCEPKVKTIGNKVTVYCVDSEGYMCNE
ncbi:MAG: hypothetical protein II843_01730 [Alphaproteobacteria bacterium]|nr:hypothetical protein [Alphaproteobacteria bacterium]